MSSQCVTLIDHDRQVVATAHVAEQQGQFIGRIDCSTMPLPLQRLQQRLQMPLDRNLRSQPLLPET